LNWRVNWEEWNGHSVKREDLASEKKGCPWPKTLLILGGV
jgi:hypothetical protein